MAYELDLISARASAPSLASVADHIVSFADGDPVVQRLLDHHLTERAQLRLDAEVEEKNERQWENDASCRTVTLSKAKSEEIGDIILAPIYEDIDAVLLSDAIANKKHDVSELSEPLVQALDSAAAPPSPASSELEVRFDSGTLVADAQTASLSPWLWYVPVHGAWDAAANRPKVLGYARSADRPKCLARAGKGQANVPPLHWSLTVEQWLMFVAACAETRTWTALAEIKGEYRINMYDMKDLFVVPLTRGTGCSIALLLTEATSQKSKFSGVPSEEMANPSQVGLMLSHAWAGSVVETYKCFQSIVNHHGISRTTPVFFCTFSMYQPEDDAPGGLSIAEQLKLEPFACINDSNPHHGMFVCHTRAFEVYERMWTVHEVDAAKRADVQTRALADLWRFQVPKKFEVSTIQASCRSEDRAVLVEKIEQYGGFERLDRTICHVREQMARQLEELSKSMKHDTMGFGSYSTDAVEIYQSLDWKLEVGSIYDSISYGMGAMRCAQWRHMDTWPQTLWPLGQRSYPYGPPCNIEFWVCNGEHKARVRNMVGFCIAAPQVGGRDFMWEGVNLKGSDAYIISWYNLSFYP